ncbi:hypothetical protein VNO78_07748 [Psophocarpus tetragonolobus]|uniref:Uncharacterized protein n=1 Tax=Psophocarpus tetragonolobus TaxID=3891 RepID=A0AAN9STL1_PSOTE
MNVKAAVAFVVFASCFLFMLYKLMSSWFIEVLVVVFCIGGIESLNHAFLASAGLANLLGCPFVQPWDFLLFFDIPKILSPCKTKGALSMLENHTSKFLGAISYLTLAVSLFCITFAVLWGVALISQFYRLCTKSKGLFVLDFMDLDDIGKKRGDLMVLRTNEEPEDPAHI